jgi:hypothetical protein
MKKLALYILFFASNNLFSQEIKFDDYFYDKTMRIDYFHSGNYYEQFLTLDEVYEEPFYAGSKTKLIDKFEYGEYKFEVRDSSTNLLLYSRGYSTLFFEWLTTDEAKKIKRTFSESIVFPYPKKTVNVEFYVRNDKNEFEKKYNFYVNPRDYFIKKDKKYKFKTKDVLINGSIDKKIDLVFLPEGYSEKELKKFLKDVDKFVNSLFSVDPYKHNKSKFNIRAVLAPSSESGVDIPGQDVWKNTILNASFYTLNSERYLMTKDYKTVRDLASLVPYDHIYILVNTTKYGGGGIYNYYATCASDNPRSEYIFAHEFGHSFAGLGDEYYDSQVSYESFYNLEAEPWEPNLTTLKNFEIKWKNMIDSLTPIPTPSLPEFKGKVGVYEGGGYSAKGIYRPFIDCSMKSATVDNFCPVCKLSIQKMIDFYSE